jgi:hypothetical protein
VLGFPGVSGQIGFPVSVVNYQSTLSKKPDDRRWEWKLAQRLLLLKKDPFPLELLNLANDEITYILTRVILEALYHFWQ